MTNNVRKRFFQHKEGVNKDCYTYIRRPLHLSYVATFEDVYEAIRWEKKVKGWNRKKKKALIERDYEKLQKMMKVSVFSRLQITSNRFHRLLLQHSMLFGVAILCIVLRASHSSA